MPGLNSFDQKLIVLAGGYDKKIPFEPLAPVLIERAKVLILMGVTALKIKAAVTGCEGYDPNELEIIEVPSMEAAVETAVKLQKRGTLSPCRPPARVLTCTRILRRGESTIKTL